MNGLRESAADLANEVMVQKIIEDKTGVRLVKQQTTDPMDYIAVRDLESSTKTVSLVEMRARSCPHTQYDELFFGRHKFIQLNQVQPLNTVLNTNLLILQRNFTRFTGRKF